MVHNCYVIVSGISKYAMLHRGDIILTGAPGTVEQIKPGDVVEVEVPASARCAIPSPQRRNGEQIPRLLILLRTIDWTDTSQSKAMRSGLGTAYFRC